MSNANPPVSSPPGRPYNIDEIRFIREEVKFQHTLIGTRISWFVSAQAFLVTPFAICISNQLSRTFFLAFVGIPFLGIALSLLIVQGVKQAIRRIDEEHVRIEAYQTDHLLGPMDPIGQTRSLQFARWVPWIFMSFWTVIVLIGIGIWIYR